MTVTPRPDFRILPRVRDDNEFFWTAGAEGKLRFTRCQACGYWLHPTGPICPECHSWDLAAEDVSGDAAVHTFTINHQAWIPGFEPPYVVGIVELPEQVGLRLTTNIVNVEPDEVRIGMPVRVTFEQWEDVWLPLFEPA